MLSEYIDRLKKEISQGGTDMNAMDSDSSKPSYWQRIFLQSKANGAAYTGEELPGRHWDWPKDTYLQRRLQKNKFLQPMENSSLN